MCKLKSKLKIKIHNYVKFLRPQKVINNIIINYRKNYKHKYI